MNQLNRFCKLVGKDELFYNSPETQAFLQNTSSVEKAINGCQKETQQTILGRYKERWQMPTVSLKFIKKISLGF